MSDEAAAAAPAASTPEKDEEEQLDARLWPLLCDAHCHPQLDAARLLDASARLRPRHIAAMSVAYDVDWGLVDRLARLGELLFFLCCCVFLCVFCLSL
jgi:hypothetical protein